MPRNRTRIERVLPARERAADLHVHTTHSDGTYSPGEVVRAAAAVGLVALAITDHDNVSAHAIARPEADRLGIELVPGIELTCESDGRDIHMLGYDLYLDDPALGAAAKELRAAREERFVEMSRRLTRLGYRIDAEAVRGTWPRAVLGRRHLAEWLVRTGQINTRREVFARLLNDGGPAQVPRLALSVDRALGLIRGAGGVAALAHPSYDLSMDMIRDWVAAGLAGIEVDGPGFTSRLSRRYRAWAAELGLVPVAGSDFHAPDRPGGWVGSITTPMSDLEQLRRARSFSVAGAGP